MADGTGIEWTDATWSPIRARDPLTGRVGWHCEHATPGCENCYAEKINMRLGTGYPFIRQNRAVVEPFLDDKMLAQPLRWRRSRKIFVCSMTDLFADFVSDEWIDRVFAVMALAPQHTFQVLTKRAARMREYMTDPQMGLRVNQACIDVDRERWVSACMRPYDAGHPPTGHFPWIWLGVSVEDQARADERIPLLIDTPAAVRFISAEPLLGPVDLTRLCIVPQKPGSIRAGIHVDSLRNKHCESGVERGLGPLDWVIAGGESGPGARPMHPDWARSLRDQCATAGVAFHFKQWGAFAPHRAAGIYEKAERIDFADGSSCMLRVGKKAAGRLLDGRTHDEFPR